MTPQRDKRADREYSFNYPRPLARQTAAKMAVTCHPDGDRESVDDAIAAFVRILAWLDQPDGKNEFVALLRCFDIGPGLFFNTLTLAGELARREAQ